MRAIALSALRTAATLVHAGRAPSPARREMVASALIAGLAAIGLLACGGSRPVVAGDRPAGHLVVDAPPAGKLLVSHPAGVRALSSRATVEMLTSLVGEDYAYAGECGRSEQCKAWR
jgi:hypothetical protein